MKYAHPSADVILSPACTKRATKKMIGYAGYHELAYLHPYRFTPDESVLHESGIIPANVFLF